MKMVPFVVIVLLLVALFALMTALLVEDNPIVDLLVELN